jgi:HD-like signal output (HDOD) protein
VDFQGIVQNVESLPSLSDSALRIRALYSKGDELNIKSLVREIESDALLTANILKMINSPLYGFSKQISSVMQAVTLFGVQMVYGLVVNYAIHSVVVANLRAYGVNNSRFNEVCQMQSMLMKKWYTPIDSFQANLLTPLALIMESGKLITAKEITLSGKIKEFHAGLKDAENISVYEHEVFGTSSYFVSGLLFEHWNLDKLYVDLLKGLDYEYDKNSTQNIKYIDSLDVIRTAVNVNDILSDKSISKAAELVVEIGLNKSHFLEVAREIQYNYEKTQ